MAKAVVAAMRDSGFRDVVVVARSEVGGRNLVETYGYSWAPNVGDGAELLIYVTPIGMAGGEEEQQLSFAPDQVAAASVVFDVVALPAETPLIRAAREAGKQVVTGAGVAPFVFGNGPELSPCSRDIFNECA